MAEEKPKTPKEKETEDINGRWRKSSLWSVGIAALSIPVLIVGTAYTELKSKKMRPEKNPVVDQYNEARNTLSHLNSRLRTLERQDQLYVPENLDEELKHIFIPPRQDLERAVQVVENDIQTIEDTSDALRNYNELVDIADEFDEKGFLYTLISTFGVIGVGILNVIRGNKVRKRRSEKIEKKYKGCSAQ